jgi:ketosteroid isomerase-like protein
MNPQAFIKQYELALASQQWDQVAPLIHTDACVTFSDGTVHQGIAAIAIAYQRNFELIVNESYAISHVQSIEVSQDVAVYTFKFSWHGMVAGQQASGSGWGTTVIKITQGRWMLIAEHLSR